MFIEPRGRQATVHTYLKDGYICILRAFLRAHQSLEIVSTAGDNQGGGGSWAAAQSSVDVINQA